MKTTVFILAGTLCVNGLNAQTYSHPTTGLAGEYVGACEVADCSGTYVDNGGAAGNYSNNINAIYRVFCPDAAGNCVRLTFNSFATEPQVDPLGPSPMGCYYDYLTVGNGSTQNSPLLSIPGVTDGSNRICGSPATPFSVTSTAAGNGCLTLRFTSDGTINMAGWSATLSCVACAGGPTGAANNDCVNYTQICSDAAVASNSQGPGIAAEACGGGGCPAGGENYSNWYQVTISSSGTFMFTIIPSTPTDDYDFAVYGPSLTCATMGAPIRCSDAGTAGATGMNLAAIDNSESVTGDGFVNDINATVGQTYLIMIDEWTPTGAGYTLDFTGSAGLDCTPLSIKLLSFNGNYNNKTKEVDLTWITENEVNNDRYEIEKSSDGISFEKIGIVRGKVYSNERANYFFTDQYPSLNDINYYRIKQVDLDNRSTLTDVVAVAIDDPYGRMNVVPNPATNEVRVSFLGNNNTRAIISIYNSTGVKVMEKSMDTVEDLNTVNLDISKLSQGGYFLVFSDGSRYITQRLIKN